MTSAPSRLPHRSRRACSGVPLAFAADQAGAVAGRLLHEHAGGAVLVIAGEPAFTQMLHALGSADHAGAGPDDSEVMYVVSVPSFGRARLVRLHL